MSWVGLLALGGATTCPAAGREVALVASSDGGSATEGGQVPEGVGPSGVLTLEAAWSLALRDNPALASDSSEVRARLAEARQAARRPNPELALELENFGGSGGTAGLDASETTLGVSQRLELGGKRERRADAARLLAALADRDVALRRVDVLARTSDSFVRVLAAQQHVALADTLVDVAERVLASVQRRVAEGGASSIEARRARVAAEAARLERNRAARTLDAERFRLAASWGSVVPGFERAAGAIDFAGVADVPALESLLRRAEAGPESARWDVELESRQAEQRLAGSAGVPDLTVGGGVRHLNEPDERAFVLGVAVPLPLFDRNRDAAEAAQVRTEQVRGRRAAALAEVRLALASAHSDLASAGAEAEALRDVILAEAEAAFAEAHEAYARGRLRLTDVLDAERTLAELRGRYIDVLADYRRSIVEIERLIGAPLQESTTTTGAVR